MQFKKPHTRKKFTQFMTGVLSTGLVSAMMMLGSSAHAYPDNKPIELIVPYSAGSNLDRYGRAAAPVLSKILGVPVVVNNLPGVNGWNRIYRSKPDGHTIGLGEPMAQLALAHAQDLPYKLVGDDGFSWIGRFATGSQMLGTPAKTPFKTVEDLKAAERPVRCGTFGGITVGAIQCAVLASKYDFPITYINFEGAPQLAFAAVRGDVDLGGIGVNLWLEHIEAGNIDPLLVWAKDRDSRVPDVPALSDIGFEEFSDVTASRAIFGPPGLDQDIIEKLTEAFNQVAQDPDYTAVLEKGKMEDDYLFSPEYRASLEAIDPVLADYVKIINDLY